MMEMLNVRVVIITIRYLQCSKPSDDDAIVADYTMADQLEFWVESNYPWNDGYLSPIRLSI